jgi:hypothetical protein
MGYYYEKARTSKDLDEEQLERYDELRTTGAKELPELLSRLQELKEYIGPLCNGETMSAHEELVQDAIVTWILADEDPEEVAWSVPSDLVIAPPPLTEEEKQASAEAWRAIIERQDRRRAEEEASIKERKKGLRARYLKNPLLIVSDWFFRLKQDLLG